MVLETLKIIFNRDLSKLKTEIELYKHDGNLWKVEKQIANSAGNLASHRSLSFWTEMLSLNVESEKTYLIS